MLIIDSPLAGIRAGQLSARVGLLASLEAQNIEIAGRMTPLEADLTAALAAARSASHPS